MSNNPEGESFIAKAHDPLISLLNKLIVISVKLLAIMMVLVIFWGVIGVVIYLYENIITTPLAVRNIENLLPILGTFLAILIAIEVFLNIVFYLKEDAIHVPLVLGTALTAIARKVIILDYTATAPEYLYGTASLIIAVGFVYWLVTKKTTYQ